MPQRPPGARVVVTHPSGKYSVHVSPGRAQVLVDRGWRGGARPATPPATTPAPTRADLNARAKALGIPAVGTNAVLAAAIAAAEAQA